MEIVFLQNSATQPRCHKRYRSFVEAGVDGTVYSFHRNWYNVNLPKDIEINSLGDITSGNHVKRLVYYIRKIKPVFRKHPNAVFYCYGLDIAFVAYLFGRKYVYEESDLIYLPYKPLLRKIIQKLDLFVQRHSVATVLTSQGFLEYLYDVKPENVFVFPNKLPSVYESISRPQPVNSFNMIKLRFAFVGLLRYETTVTPFIDELMKFNSNYEFHFWGDGDDKGKAYVNKLCEKYENVQYHGPFRNPDDLPQIYSKFDINFVCYEIISDNERTAEPNKLYESLFYLKPMMVTPGTYLSRVVKRIGNGFVVNCHDKKNICTFLESLSQQKLMEKVQSCSNIPSNEIIDNKNDVEELIDYVKKTVKCKLCR